MADLAGKVAVVTGGASGIGAAVVRLLTSRGASVVSADLNVADGEAVARAAGERAVFLRTDVSSEADSKALVDLAVSRFGGLDMAFNNAGIDGPSLPLAEQTGETFQQVFAVNMLGVFLGMKYQIQAMLARGGGAIVNTSSIAGLRGHPGISLYSASKHGVNGLTKSAAIEYGQHNIRINSVCPGGIQTPMLAEYLESNPQLKALIIDNNPMRRMGESEEMAQAAVWLASPAASYVNGQELAVDGGKICSDV